MADPDGRPGPQGGLVEMPDARADWGWDARASLHREPPDVSVWVSPVWFASQDYYNFHWISSPHVEHSRNLAVRPEVAVAVFDPSVPVGSGQAVYMKGVARELTGTELHQGLDVFDRASRRDVGSGWQLEDVEGQAPFRLYRATISEHRVLIRGSDPLRGSGVDRSERVSLD